MPPLFYFAYLVGVYALNLPTADFSMDAILSGELLFPFLTGCLMLGIICSTAGYFGFSYFWRYHTINKWQHRQQHRQQLARTKNPCRSIEWRL